MSARGWIEASAPGRLDVLGGVADYSGSLLLQLPIEERTYVRWRPVAGETLRLSSAAEARGGGAVPLAWLKMAAETGDYGAFRQNLSAADLPGWTLYVLGGFIKLHAAGMIPLEAGEIEVRSEVPIGQGLSSSAALEVASLRVLAKAYDLDLLGLTLPVLAQAVENEVVGAPCGLMDQLASHCGVPGQLLPIECRPAEIFAPIALPSNVRLERWPSGVEHRVTGTAYADARAAAFMGKRILAREAGVEVDYLAELDWAAFRQNLMHVLPEEILGEDFLRRYGSTDDAFTRIAPTRRYRVRAASAHPIAEHARITDVADALRVCAGGILAKADLRAFSEALYASHAGYTAIGLGHAATDALVAEARKRGEAEGYFGARVTGGGCGGTVVVLRAA